MTPGVPFTLLFGGTEVDFARVTAEAETRDKAAVMAARIAEPRETVILLERATGKRWTWRAGSWA